MNREVRVFADDLEVSHLHDIERSTMVLRAALLRADNLFDQIPPKYGALVESAMRQQQIVFYPRYVSSEWIPKDGKFKTLPCQLLIYLIWFHAFETTQPHDHIYALHGMTTQAWELPSPDYNLTAEAVYLQHAKWFVNQGYGIDMMLMAGLSYAVCKDLPSWCPNWTSVKTSNGGFPLSRALIRDMIGYGADKMPRDLPSAGLFSTPLVSLSKDGTALIARGALILTVEAVVAGTTENFLKMFALHRALVGAYATPKNLSEEFQDSVRKLLAEEEYQRPSCVEDIFCSYSRWDYCFQLFHASQDLIPDNSGATEAKLLALFKDLGFPFGKQCGICASECGFIGFVPAETELNDHIAIFRGSILPMIVRKCDDGSVQLVGDAYFPDLARGEGFDWANDGMQDIVIV